MKKSRMIGNFVEQKASQKRISISDLSNELNCKTCQVKSFLKGRSFASYNQLCTLAQVLDVPVAKIVQGDSTLYNKTVVHCMNEFTNEENREKVLNIIDNYMDIKDSLIR